jgi:predicted nucleotidyltransferase
MNKEAGMIEYLVTSKTMRKLLSLFLTHPGEKFYARQLERLLDEPVSAVRRELNKLEKPGFLLSKHEIPVKYYWVNTRHPVYEEMKGLVLKTQAMGDYLRTLIKDTKGIVAAFIYGSVAKGEENSRSDIDLMVIGSIDPGFLHKKIVKIEHAIKRVIQYSLMRETEFRQRDDRFINRVVGDKKIFLIGSGSELKRLRAGR